MLLTSKMKDSLYSLKVTEKNDWHHHRAKQDFLLVLDYFR